MASKNIYHKRQVAQAAAKSCWICYKPSSIVLITPESDDWFHICAGHLTDRNFATAQDAVDEEQLKKQRELEQEIEAVKKEYEEKLKKKKSKKKDEKSTEDDEKEKEQKLKVLEDKKSESKTDDGPRVFELGRHFYQMRLQKKQQANLAKKNRERLQNPAALPSVPAGDP